MDFTAILVPLAFALVFLLPAWFLYTTGRRAWATAPAAIALILFLFTLTVYYQDAARVQATYELDLLLAELDDPKLFTLDNLADPDDRLFLASVASTALYRAWEAQPARRAQLESYLRTLAETVTDRRRFPTWTTRGRLQNQAFFLAHAGATLGHYQLATNDETFADDWRFLGDRLTRALRTSAYKNLISRPGEEFHRPADNAAALYALRLYDTYYGEENAARVFEEWTAYTAAELYHAESRIPCAAFNATNRCRLEPSATATGLYVAYRAAASPQSLPDDIPLVEWEHYFKRTTLSAYSLSIRPNMRAGRDTRFCDLGAAPLPCQTHERAIALWAAAEYDHGYTYFRLLTGPVLRRWFYPRPNFSALGPNARVTVLTRIALRSCGYWA